MVNSLTRTQPILIVNLIYELDKLLLKTSSSFYDYLKWLFVDSFYF